MLHGAGPGCAGCLRLAAAADLHCSEDRREAVAQSLAGLRGTADLVLLAGDLTTTGQPEEAQVLAEACAPLPMPVFAVLGNHDCHAERRNDAVLALDIGRARG